jgi:hypothetical protein
MILKWLFSSKNTNSILPDRDEGMVYVEMYTANNWHIIGECSGYTFRAQYGNRRGTFRATDKRSGVAVDFIQN